MKIPSRMDFVLHGGDSSFVNRQRALFDQLSEAEKACNKNQESPNSPEIESRQLSRPIQAGKRRRSETRQFRGKESIFKRPELPAPITKYRSIPDYHRNPHKWVKYTLDDVANVSDKSNTQTALSFLRELRIRKKREQVNNDEEQMEIDSEFKNPTNCPMTSRVSFRKPSRNIEKKQGTMIVDNNDKPVFRSSKVILPEYVVGQKQVKKSKNEKKIVKVDRTKEMKLDHLQEPEDED